MYKKPPIEKITDKFSKNERTKFKRDAQGRVTRIKRYSNSKTPVSDSLSTQIKKKELKLKKKKKTDLAKKFKSMRETSKRMEDWTFGKDTTPKKHKKKKKKQKHPQYYIHQGKAYPVVGAKHKKKKKRKR